MLALLSGLFAALFSTTAAYFTAIKAVLVTLMMVILPIIFKNLLAWFVTGLLSLVTTYTGGATSTIVSLGGVAAYLANGMGLPAAFAVILAAVATKFTLKLIPFVRL